MRLSIVLLLVFFALGCIQQINEKSISDNQTYSNDYGKFNEIKKEIDYWYNQGPEKIGQYHKNQLLQRLSELQGIPISEIDEYVQKLDSIVLVKESQPIQELPQQQQNQDCNETEISFTYPPMKLENIEIIEPIGLMIGGHVTPIDHGYYYAKSWTPKREDASTFVDVLAPASGIITELNSMPAEFASSSFGDYRFEIQHTCSIKTIYIHVNQLSDKLKNVVGTRKPIRVEAGEVLGKAPGFDFSVHNTNITLKGFVVPEHYNIEPWKIHTVDMFDYFVEPLKSQLLQKNVRQQEPRGGTIDYDIDGKLVGNWFEVNTNWYEGKKEYNRVTGYWSTHLAFAYDGFVPGTIVISMGNFSGAAQQYGVKGNSPDPSAIDVSNGIVKYELVTYEYLTENGEMWDKIHFSKLTSTKPSSQVEGVVLVQMLEDRKIKFEAFPGKIASQVSGFTSNAKVYER